MNNLKKPIFWAFVLFDLFFLVFAIGGLIRMPFLFLRIVYGAMGLLVGYFLIVLLRKPFSDKPVVGFAGIISGLIFIVGGTMNLNGLLERPTLNHFEYQPWFDLLPVIFIVMVSSGGLMVILSVVGLVKNAISKISASPRLKT